MATRMSIPNIAGTLLLIVVLAALLPVYNIFLNNLMPQLGTVSQFILQLLLPSIFLAILANIWDDDEPRR